MTTEPSSSPSREPDFGNLLKVLNRQCPDRPTLFEFFLNEPLYQKLAGGPVATAANRLEQYQNTIRAFRNVGYDYATVRGSDFSFPQGDRQHASSISANEGALIHDRTSFQAYPWPDPAAFDYSILATIAPHLPNGMKLIVMGPGGVLENVMALVGYDATCYMIMDDPKLATEIFAAIGERLVRHYELAAPYATVGALISNDDWGFKTQPMFSPADMRRFVLPWHRKIAATIHAAGKPAILHSCGCLHALMDDIIDDLKYDGKHSYEDAIMPVEQAYEQWHSRTAILGGLDLDFVCRSTPQAVQERAAAMLTRSAKCGSYALGTGNSVPTYVPPVNYFAMVTAATGLIYSQYL